MVGLVLVSHSRALALAVQELVRAMTGPDLRLAIAAGVGDDRAELGTDAVEICEAIAAVDSPEGVIVLMDMGSAILSSEMALDLIDEEVRPRVRFCAAPFVEGAVAAAVTAQSGADIGTVCAEALGSLKQKTVALKAEAEPAAVVPAPAVVAGSAKSIRVTVRNPHGLHARPAARLIAECRSFQAEITVRNVTRQHGPVSVKSLSGLASLEILEGDEIEVTAGGDDATAALDRIRQLVEEGLGDAVPAKPRAPGAKAPPLVATRSSGPIPVSEGAAVGPIAAFCPSRRAVAQEGTEDIDGQAERLRKAIAAVRENLELRRERMAKSVGTGQADIYQAQNLALQDPDLVDVALGLIRDQHWTAASAWSEANRRIVSRYESLSDAYLRERATDLEDVGVQVLEQLGVSPAPELEMAVPSIVVAENLTPTQVAALPRDKVLGVLLLDGGPTAHSSILLRALGLPAMVQARAYLGSLEALDTKTIAFDTARRKFWINPSPEIGAKIRGRIACDARRAAEEKQASTEPGATSDGQRVEIFANVGAAADVAPALACGAEGVGLLRTEFLFLDRATAPTEDEQVEALRAAAEPLQGRPLVVRTLDVGGDKPLSYIPMAVEENPFLGVRAVRLGFAQPELFTTHLRAILRAGHGHDLRVMFPMIADASDLARARNCLCQAHASLETDGIAHSWPVSTGIMIEIPSAALTSGELAEQVEFFSVGTNDLTQYALAADRGNPELAAYHDALHPGVLRLIDAVVKGARPRGRLVAACGEAAADEFAAAIFVGLGLRELSMTGRSIPRIKAALRRRSLVEMEDLAHRALGCSTAAEVRQMTW